MPKGMTGVRGAVQDIRNRSAGGGGESILWFKVEDGEEEVVRFLEQGEEVKWAWVHEIPIEGKSAPRLEPCRDQDDSGDRIGEACPGCEQKLRRKFQGYVNVIWRDAPVFDRDAEGRMKRDSARKPIIIGRQDQVAVWQQGVTVFEELDGKDVTYKGLGSRDFRIKRRGQQLNTTYSIEPADPDAGPQPLSDADKALADDKYDLSPKVTARSYEDWGKSGSTSSNGGSNQAQPRVDVSPFMRGK